MIEIHIVGLPELEGKFIRIGPKASKLLIETLEKQANALAAMQRRLVPVDTGALRASIGWRRGDSPLQLRVGAGSDDVPYAALVEFGTVETPARPYFFPSYRAQKKKIGRAINAAIRKAIRQS